MAKLTLEEWLTRLENNRRFMENVRAVKHLPAAQGRFTDFPDWVHPRLRQILENRGIRGGFTAIRPKRLGLSGRAVMWSW